MASSWLEGRRLRRHNHAVTSWLLLTILLAPAQQATYDAPPVNYSKSTPTDAVAVLEGRLAAGRAVLKFEDAQGYLKGVLKELAIPASSQSLVFSKTSFQRHYITPNSPRALYYNDEVYVGWVQGGEVVEIASQDPQLGTVFYVVGQDASKPARFLRQTDNCLQCHDSTGLTLGVPGVTVRSMYTGPDGQPRFNLGGFRTTYHSSFEDRWGGWYVTGEHGSMRHLGNVWFPDDPHPDLKPLRAKGANLGDLTKKIDTAPYLTDTSDIVALMVLEYQTTLHNLITKANHETRAAIAQSDEIHRSLEEPLRPLSEGSQRRVGYACEPLVEALFYVDEAPIPSPVKGNSTFRVDFEKRGPVDGRGRSLRQFDLTRRMFRYPLSFLVYSKAFAGLPREAHDFVARRIKEILEGRETMPEFAHVTPELRQAIREILTDTHPDLAAALR